MRKVAKEIQSALSMELPGMTEHLRMTPYRALTKVIPEKRREGAVLLMLYKKNDNWYFPLMQRHDYEGVHANQISFPGGKVEKEDANKYQTALRETEEEIGIKSSSIQYVGELSEIYIPPSNFLVSAFVGICNEVPVFVKEEKEVKEILEIPLTDLFDPTREKETRVKLKGGVQLKTPYLELNNSVVWGATAAILAEFKSVLKDKQILFQKD